MEKAKRRAALHNLGCKVNAYETEAMGQLLEAAGYELVPFEERADVYLVNTCSVTNMADRKSRQMLHRARKQNPEAVVVAAGCYVQAAADEIAAHGDADLVIGNNQKNRLPDLLEEYFEKRGEKQAGRAVIDIAHAGEYEELSISRTVEHTRAFVKIQDGCNQFCSYCIIPYTRGRIRSRKKEDVLAEIRALAGRGYKEAVLTGIHLSSYGKDLGERDALLSVIEEAAAIPGVSRIRLGSLEPGVITEEFVRRIVQVKELCPHFHLSLQSGCDSVLKRMNRHYSTAEYGEKCALLREYYEHPAITTDVITGFPGESDEEFEDTMEFLERIGFYEMHVFKYSRRKGTRAAAMAGQVPEPVKAERSRRAIALGEQMSEEFRRYYLGRKGSLLLEEPHVIGGKTYMTGFTEEYVKGAVEMDEGAESGAIVPVHFTEFLEKDLLKGEKGLDSRSILY